MERILIPAGRRPSKTARELLDIVGPDRAGEVESVTWPEVGYLVCEDVAIEYFRRATPPYVGIPAAPEPAAASVEMEPGPAPEPVVERKQAVKTAVRRTPAGRKNDG